MPRSESRISEHRPPQIAVPLEGVHREVEVSVEDEGSFHGHTQTVMRRFLAAIGHSPVHRPRSTTAADSYLATVGQM